MWYVLGENGNGEFEVWENLTAREALAVRTEYLKLNMLTRAGKMSKRG